MAAELLPIVADTPSANPHLGFEAYAEAIAGAVRGGRPPQFTIGIYGAWGSGKSSLLNAIHAELEQCEDVLPVAFDAWRYERADHIILPLLNAVHNQIPKLNDPALTGKVRQALESVIRSISFNIGPLTINPGAALLPQSTSSNYTEAMDAAYVRPYADMRAIGTALERRRIAVLIDDLDRCSPDKVVALLEAINLVMDVPGFVFVIALDYDVLVKAVGMKYPHSSGHVFIEKMVQVPFRVPRLDIRADTFLPELIPDWQRHAKGLPGDFTDIAYDVATLGLAANPRQVKRFINSLLVLLRIADRRSYAPAARLIAGLVGLQLRWPAEFQDLADAAYAEDPSPLDSVVRSEQPDLARYAQALFLPTPESDELRAVLQLTQSVAQPEAYSGYQTGEYDGGDTLGADSLRKNAVATITEALLRQGFVESNAALHIFRHVRLPEHRIKIGKTVIRFEARDPEGRWLLGESFLLTRAGDDTLDMINDLNHLQARIDSAINGSYGSGRLPMGSALRRS